jgi:hypothetical protein
MAQNKSNDMGFSEYGYEILGPIKGWKLLAFLKDCQLFTEVLVGLLLSLSAFPRFLNFLDMITCHIILHIN